MKKKLIYCGFAVASVLGLGSCNDDITTAGDRQGRIFPSIDLDSKVISSYDDDATSRSTVGDITVADLSLRLTRDDGALEENWISVNDFPANYECPVGAYTLVAYYGSMQEEGFEKPCFYGSDRIMVEENRTSTVSIQATLANSMVSVDYTDAFKKYFSDYSAELTSAAGQTITYVAGETRPAYFNEGTVKVAVRVVDPVGREVTLQPASITTEARHHYHLTFDVNNGEVGTAVISISFDDLLEQEPVVIELSEALINSPAPEMTPVGFVAGETVNFVEGSTSEGSLSVNVIAKGGISSVEMTTKSASLLSQGWPAVVDLAATDAATLATLNRLGLKTIGLSGNIDKMAVVQLANVISHIGYVSGDDNVSTFSFAVKDRYGKITAEPLVLSVGITESRFEFADFEPLYEWSTVLGFDIVYNGTDAQKSVSFECLNDRGTYSAVPVNSFEAVAGKEDTYHVALTVPSSAAALNLRAVVDGTQITRTIERVDADEAPHTHVLSAPENGIFAHTAAMNIAPLSRGASRSAADYKVKISADGKSWADATVADATSNTFKLTGLEGGTSYQVRAIVDGIPTEKVSFQTEAAAQLPNNNMEAWSRTDGKTQYWWIEYPNADKANGAWATMNELTTSVGDGNTNAFSHKGTSYCAYSGTRQTTDAAQGTYAAIIETVGWGDNDANGGTTVGKGCKNLTVGELFLGSYSGGANYTGTAFGSRPSAMTFQYKYRYKNSADYGMAEVEVLNASGKVIASGSLQLTAVDSYTQQSIPLTYNTTDGKAALVKVSFKSSGNPDCQSINTTNLDCPKLGNLSDGRFTGSSLYIDEITFEY